MMGKIKKKILITGIQGMLGQDLSQVFDSDYEVYGIDINPDTDKPRVFLADITQRKDLEALFLQIKPWMVIHGAAFTNVDLAESEQEQAKAVNVLGTENIAFLCQQYNAKLIFISTDYVFDGNKKTAYIETDKPYPLNYYGCSKLAAEQRVAACLTEYIIVRTSWLFGTKGKNFVKAIVNKARADGDLKVVNDQIGSPTYTLSLAQALFWLTKSVFQSESEQSSYGIYHVSNSGQCSWFEFAQAILELTGIKAKLEPVDSDYIARAAKRPKFSVMDKSRFEKITGKKLCLWKQALEQYLSQEKNQVVLPEE
ncbi:MAG: dTDP-4-dehydrorhamnose reductase [Candidatus Omnitrophica bacterium]|nr:dTDP-4-dehydrorhamnose reductase [Candidatus Omnitrophota bacterium]